MRLIPAISLVIRLALVALVSSPVSAQTVVPTPVREYLFSGNLADASGGPNMVALGGGVIDEAYVFAANQGLLLSDLSLDTGTYSFELGFTFFTLGGYQKIIDFANRASDSGFYVLGNSLNFYPVVNTGLVDVRANEAVHVMLTRDGATSAVAVYVNGQLGFTFTDSGGRGEISGALREIYFFTDDFPTGGEAGPGSVDFIRIYNQSLDAAQVSELFTNGPVVVPEPSTAVLLLIGIGALLGGRMLRNSRKMVGDSKS